MSENRQSVRAQAAEWLARRDRGPWDQEDQTALEQWLGQSLAHSTAFWRLEAAWNRANRLRAARGDGGNRFLQAVSNRFTPMLFRAAAAALVIGVAGTSAFYAMQPRERSYETTVGGHETLTLGDGTKVELNTDTKVRVSQDRRKVWLDRGELDKIIERSSASEAPPPPQQQPQPQAGQPWGQPQHPAQGYDPRYTHGHKPYKRRKSFLEELFD